MEALIAFLTLYLKDALLLFGSSFATWFFVRKKQKAETSTVEIDNGQKIIELYQQSLTDLELRHKEQFDELKKMYEAKFQAFKVQIESFTLQIDNLHKELDLWKTKYEASQKELKNKK
jgi:uncharacterized membrane protein